MLLLETCTKPLQKNCRKNFQHPSPVSERHRAPRSVRTFLPFWPSTKEMNRQKKIVIDKMIAWLGLQVHTQIRDTRRMICMLFRKQPNIQRSLNCEEINTVRFGFLCGSPLRICECANQSIPAHKSHTLFSKCIYPLRAPFVCCFCVCCCAGCCCLDHMITN